MLDVLNEEKEIEDETAAVLGGSDEKNCTYLRVTYTAIFTIYSALVTLSYSTGPH